jgi:hypothetical protein
MQFLHAVALGRIEKRRPYSNLSCLTTCLHDIRRIVPFYLGTLKERSGERKKEYRIFTLLCHLQHEKIVAFRLVGAAFR